MTGLTAIIPARGGSKGVPRKNIKDLCGHPLISYSITACLQSEHISRVIVSTDDEEIAQVSRLYGAEVPFMRPSELAADNSTDYDVIKDFFENCSENYVAFMRPTTPIRDSKKIDEFINFFFENKEKMSG